MQRKYSIVFVTVGSRRQANLLAERLVEERLAACVQVHRIRSFYRWNGAVRSGGEYLLMAKTGTELFAAVSDFVAKQHAYQTPEIIRVDIGGGSGEYLRWMDDCL